MGAGSALELTLNAFGRNNRQGMSPASPNRCNRCALMPLRSLHVEIVKAVQVVSAKGGPAWGGELVEFVER